MTRLRFVAARFPLSVVQPKPLGLARTLGATAVVAVGVLLGACTAASDEGETGETEAATAGGETAGGEPNGMLLYESPVDGGNTFSCAHCHALGEEDDARLRRPGHPLTGVTERPSYKNGQVGTMREAVNSCLEEWMGAEPWSAEDPNWLALESFLGDHTAGDNSAISYNIVQPPADLSGGDAEAGKTLFNASCAVCHGQDAGGSPAGPPIGGFADNLGYVGDRVRLSGNSESPVYEGLAGGRMPFWAEDRLSDDELRDLAAFLEAEPDPPAGEGGSEGDAGGEAGGRECDATHERVGWTAELQDFFHNVGGTAEIVDDCTVEIRMFTYDGTGIDVRMYGGKDGDYTNGYAMTGDLLKSGGYNGETLIATLPEGESLDDLDGISVWCVAVAVDFGSGNFAP